jgi:hypothetical protein
MNPGRVSAVLGLLCLLVFVHVSDSAGQTLGSLQIPSGVSVDPLCPAQSNGRNDLWSGPSLDVGWMTVLNRVSLGYNGLVPPGACVSSFFVYPLSGFQIGGSLPIRLTDEHGFRIYGSYLIANNAQAGQEITWTNNPPGTREWRHSKTEAYKLGAEILLPVSGETAIIGGFRLESLLTNFSDPNPDYLFTIPSMEAQTTLTIYEPYWGIRLQQNSGSHGSKFQAIGFPFLFATVQHLNVCNNSGVPFAHTGRQNASKGFFVEASAEYWLGLSQGVEVAGFVNWNVYQGRCPMTIERHEGGPNPAVTEATVDWSHYMSTLVIGGKLQIGWNLP